MLSFQQRVNLVRYQDQIENPSKSLCNIDIHSWSVNKSPSNDFLFSVISQ